MLIAVVLMKGAHALAQVQDPTCLMERSAANMTSARVLGFPGQRLYLHPQPPFECTAAGGPACEARAYVLSGQIVTAGAECEGWRYVSYEGEKKRTVGWVQSQRIAEAASVEGPDPWGADAAEEAKSHPVHTAAGAACQTVYRQLNEATALPEGPSYLPSALQGENGSTASQITVRGQPLSVVRTASGARSRLELWSMDPRRLVASVGDEDPPADEEDADVSGQYYNTRDDIVSVNGALYFVNYGVGLTNVTMFRFKKDRSIEAVCNITKVPTWQERIRFAADAPLCHATLTGAVEEPKWTEIRPYKVTAAALEASVGSSNSPWFTTLDVVARGLIATGPNGGSQSMAILRASGSTKDQEWFFEWPVIVDGEGTPATNSPFNRFVYQQVRPNDATRLFRFRGASYFERREEGPAFDVASAHQVWAFGPTGATLMCSFVPYRFAMDVFDSGEE
jgi:hypothetical protein